MSDARRRAEEALAQVDAHDCSNTDCDKPRSCFGLCIEALRALLAEPAGLRDAIEIEREGQRSMARALAEINRLSRLDVAVNLAEPAPAPDAVLRAALAEHRDAKGKEAGS